HFSISDVVLVGDLPESLQKDAEMYAGCVAGAIQKNDYLQLIEAVGFESILVQKEKAINLPADILSKYLTADEIDQFTTGDSGIFSITVFAQKAGIKKRKVKISELQNDACCSPGSGCC